jgi:segregation and condensation protein A
MTYEVKTRVFEGPLDLLLQLITSHQVEITEVNLTDIVTEYLASLDEMRALDLEVTSEFLLIAATLIQLKARFLLPDDGPIDIDEELALREERDRLLARLLACLTFKDVAAVLAHRMAVNDRFVPRRLGMDPEIEPALPEVVVPLDVEDLALLASRAIAASGSEPDVDHLDLDLPSVADAIVDLRSRMAQQVESDFEAMVAHCSRSVEVVAYFLAALELAHWGILHVSQDHRDAPIALRHDPSASSEGLAAFLAEEMEA